MCSRHCTRIADAVPQLDSVGTSENFRESFACGRSKHEGMSFNLLHLRRIDIDSHLLLRQYIETTSNRNFDQF